MRQVEGYAPEWVGARRVPAPEIGGPARPRQRHVALQPHRVDTSTGECAGDEFDVAESQVERGDTDRGVVVAERGEAGPLLLYQAKRGVVIDGLKQGAQIRPGTPHLDRECALARRSRIAGQRHDDHAALLEHRTHALASAVELRRGRAQHPVERRLRDDERMALAGEQRRESPFDVAAHRWELHGPRAKW